jgi:serine/threonine protein kinase
MGRWLGRYELIRPLAHGGMAELYLARRRTGGLEKRLVVKRMRPAFAREPRFVDMFVREARLSMGLTHRNIVPVFDFGRVDDQLFLAMELVEGKDLGLSLARATCHRLPPVLAAYIAAECCHALDYVHRRKDAGGDALGIVHRDVTPRNILLSWSGEVKLTDFGIAALAGDTARRPLGTPEYMAPEQARREPSDPRADIYACGLVLREAVSGMCARPGGDRETTLESARRGELLPWSQPADAMPERLPGDATDQASGDDRAPAALVAIIDRATAVRPDARYSDARAMLEDVEDFIVGHRAAHRGASPAHQLAAWLANVWDGADEADCDAALDAGHALDLCADGCDVLGPGTVRSLAATAAEDAQRAV